MLYLDNLFEQAIGDGINDLHFHTFAEKGKIIFRRGKKVLNEMIIEKSLMESVLNYLKFEGHYEYQKKSSFQSLAIYRLGYSLRITIAPFPHNFFVIRLHEHRIRESLDESLKYLLEIFLQKGGIWLIVGPMKSGKTSLYYEMLNYAAYKTQTVLSLEDPIEILGNTHPQLSYSSDEDLSESLLSCLRLDLDLVGIGEIRKMDHFNLLMKLPLDHLKVIATVHAQSKEEFWFRIKQTKVIDTQMLEKKIYCITLCNVEFEKNHYY